MENMLEQGSLDGSLTSLCGVVDGGTGGGWRFSADEEACMYGCHIRKMKHSLELGVLQRLVHDTCPFSNFGIGIMALAVGSRPCFNSLHDLMRDSTVLYVKETPTLHIQGMGRHTHVRACDSRNPSAELSRFSCPGARLMLAASGQSIIAAPTK